MDKAAKIKRQIELMLAKAERTDNDHERDAYTAQAQRLMLKWGIEEADLEARGEIKPEDIVEQTREYSGQFSAAMTSMAHRVTQAMGGVKTIKSGSGAKWTVYYIGHESDVANALVLMDSLERQAFAGLAAWWSTSIDRTVLGRQEGWKSRRQFLFSFGNVVAQRLYDLRSEVQEEATPGAALVLVSKQERVQAHVDGNWSTKKSRAVHAGNRTGAAAGREAGRRANIGEKSIGGVAGVLS